MDIFFRIPLVICFLMVFITTAEKSPPIISGPKFENVTVIEGETAILPCVVGSLGKYKVAWIRNVTRLITVHGKRVTNDLRFKMDRHSDGEWPLYISNVTYSDRGQYICRINTYPLTSKYINLVIIVPAKINVSSNDTAVTEGERLVLFCNATGIPKPEVTWYVFNGSGVHRQDITGELFIIEHMTRLYSGTYQCVANNGHTASKLIKVYVEFAPDVELQTKRVSQILGREVFLECKIVATPRADLYWVKDNILLDTSDKAKYQADEFHYDSSSSLSLSLPYLREDQLGEYTCRASNSIGTNSDTVVISAFSTPREENDRVLTTATSIPVNGNDTEYTGAPKVSLLAKRIGQLIGRDAVLDCKIMSFPPADMYWLKDNLTIEFFEKEKYKIGEYEGWPDRNSTWLSLTLTKLQQDQLGEYTCYANNSNGQDFDTVVVYGIQEEVLPEVQGDVSSGNSCEIMAFCVLIFYWMVDILV